MGSPNYAEQPPQGLNFHFKCNVRVRVRRLTQLEIDSAKEPQENEVAIKVKACVVRVRRLSQLEIDSATEPQEIKVAIKVKACVVRVRRLSQLEIDANNGYQANLRADHVANSPATRAGGHKGRGGIKKKNPLLAKKLKSKCVVKRKRVLWPGKRPFGLSKKSPAVVPQQVKAPGLVTKIMTKVTQIFKNVFKAKE